MADNNNPLNFLRELREEKIADKKSEIEIQKLDFEMQIQKENLDFTKELNKLRLEQVKAQLKPETKK